MSLEVKRVTIAESAKEEYGKAFIGRRGKVVKEIGPISPSADFKPARVMVRVEGGMVINFRPEDITETD